MRSDGRSPNQLRPISIDTNVQDFAEGSVIIETGLTRVLCAVSVEERVPPFLRGTGKGWVTAEYSMLPRSTITRTPRERTGGLKGRTQEIQRLIGRSLRAAVDLEQLGERTLTVDCDVLQADAGTRAAAITGAYVALHQAFITLSKRKDLAEIPLNCAVAATSIGMVGGHILLDLTYEEDYRADVDFNVVMTDKGEFVEVQGTAEEGSFSKCQLDQIMQLAETGLTELFKVQREVIVTL